MELRKTFEKYLDDNGLGILRPLLYASHTVQGYGRLDVVPALYGLMWNTPKMMKALSNRLKGTTGDTGTRLFPLYFFSAEKPKYIF